MDELKREEENAGAQSPSNASPRMRGALRDDPNSEGPLDEEAEAERSHQRDLMLLGAVGYNPEDGEKLPPGWHHVDSSVPHHEFDPWWVRLTPARRIAMEEAYLIRRLRGFMVLLGLLLAGAAVASYPTIAGPLFAADRTVDTAANMTLLRLVSAGFGIGSLVALLFGTFERAMVFLLMFSGRLLIATLLAVAAAGGWFYQAFEAAERVEWRAAVALDRPEVAEVKAAGADDEAAWAAMVRTMQSWRPIGAPFSFERAQISEASALRAASNLAEGRLPLLRAEALPWPEGEDVPWSRVPGIAVFSVGMGTPILAALQAPSGRSPKVLSRARAFFRSWQDARWRHRRWPGASGTAWSGSVAARRLLVLLETLDASVAAGPLPADEADAMLRLLIQHREVLLSRRAQAQRGREAYEIDIAMLALSTAYPWLDADLALATGARNRMAERRQAQFTDEGPLRLHAPERHCALTYLVAWHAGLRDRQQEALADGEAEHLRKMIGFARRFTHPDGTMPPIGGTAASARCRELDAWRGYGLDGTGKAAAMPGLGAVADDAHRAGRVDGWKQAGLAMLSTGAAPGGAPPMVATVAAAPSYENESFADALALTLFAGGRVLIGGPGYVPLDHPRRATLIAPTGHSSVHVNGTLSTDGHGEVVHLAAVATGTELDAGVMAVKHDLGDQLTLHRTVLYGPVAGAIMVLDHVRSERPRYVSVHERLLEQRAPRHDRALLEASWPAGNGVTLWVERFARVDGGVASSVPVHWRPPQAWSELRGSYIDIATLLSTEVRKVAVGEGARELEPGHGGELEWATDTVTWSGPRGRWIVPLQPARVSEARFEPTKP
ncbi:MAG: Heparinase N-terminus [Pseudomonadota bacterium]